jgi:hypothetical protein
LKFSTAFHPQIDGQSENVFQILEDVLRRVAVKFESSWEEYFLLVEFAYNNSFQPSIQMAPFKALYGRKCRTPLCWTELSEGKVVGTVLIRETKEEVKIIQDRVKTAHDPQKIVCCS